MPTGDKQMKSATGTDSNCLFPIEAWWLLGQGWGRFKISDELLNLGALKFSPVNKIHIFQCMVKIFCAEFQRVPLKFNTKYLTHILKDAIFNNVEISRALRFKSSYVIYKRPLINTNALPKLMLTGNWTARNSNEHLMANAILRKRAFHEIMQRVTI